MNVVLQKKHDWLYKLTFHRIFIQPDSNATRADDSVNIYEMNSLLLKKEKYLSTYNYESRLRINKIGFSL